MSSSVEVFDRLGKYNYSPHLNRSTVIFLEETLTKESEVLEIGSGNSTIWFAERAKRVVSYESSKEWYEGVMARLEERHINNVISIYDPKYPEKKFPEIIDQRFDIILSDGADYPGARVKCMMSAPHFLKFGGYLVVDDVERKAYEEGVRYLDGLNWKSIHFGGKDSWGVEKMASVYRKTK